jgi:tripartite-type tricarboxylate transporter receptor subunit TctC
MRVIAFLLLCAALIPGAAAQSWPTKPVRMVVSTGPGMSTDILGRLISDRLSRLLSQQFVVENIAGAGGIVAAQHVARATPDGYTLMFTGGGVLVTNAFAFKSIPYDPVRDFVPVALVTRASGFLVLTTPSLPVKNIPELVGYARANPGKLSYAVDVSNIYVSLVGRMLNRAAGTDIAEIPYKSTAQALQDTMAGRTQVILSSQTAADSALRAGKLRLIGVTSTRRLPAHPDTATVLEAYPKLDLDAVGFTVVAPAAIPKEVLARANGAVVTLLKDSQFEAQVATQGQPLAPPNTPEEAAEVLQEQRARWGKIFKDLAIQPQ